MLGGGGGEGAEMGEEREGIVGSAEVGEGGGEREG